MSSTSPSGSSMATGPEKESLQVIITKPDSTDIVHINPFVVSFEGPNDQTNPTKWSERRKWCIVGLASIRAQVM